MTRDVSFSATVKKKGSNPYVEVPRAASEHFGRGNVPVEGAVNGYPIRATLVPVRPQGHVLYINGEMRAGAGVGIGDTIEVRLRRDHKPRELPVPAELERALAKNAHAREVWDRLPPSHRKEYLSHLNSLKTPEALQRNIEKTVAQLLKRTTERASS